MSETVNEKSGSLGRALVARMEQMTWDRIGQLSQDNIARNRAFLHRGKSLKALREETLGATDAAIVIAAGPSIHRLDPIAEIKRAQFAGAVVTTESAMVYCLRNGVVPDLVVSVDPHDRIKRWFGEPALTQAELDADDYYRRQDMDESVRNERAFNDEVLGLLDRHGREIRIALATTASAPVVRRCLDTGMQIFWWNPMLDDPDKPDSVSREVWRRNRLPLVNAGGNVGTSCWMMAHAVLAKSHVALTGMDFSYYDGTDHLRTQYYYEIRDLVGEEKVEDVFMRIHNPYLDRWFFTDPAYMWYRECFLDLAADADCTTYNCSGGGILFGDGIEFVALSDFLERTSALVSAPSTMG